MSSLLSNIDIHFNPNGWGPIAGEKLPIFEGVPYAHFDKKERLNRAADFVQSTMQTGYQRYQVQIQ